MPWCHIFCTCPYALTWKQSWWIIICCQSLLHVLPSVACLFFYLFVSPFFVCFKWASADGHTATETRTHIHRQRLIPPAAVEAAGGTLPPLCQLVPILVEWCWNDSYLIWETHLVPSFPFLSANNPPVQPAPFLSASRPAKPSKLSCPQFCIKLAGQHIPAVSVCR